MKPWMSTMESFKHFIVRGWDIQKRNPTLFGNWLIDEVDQIIETTTDSPNVEEFLNRNSRGSGFVDKERIRGRVLLSTGKICGGFVGLE
jgi:hypothetical protein